MHLLTALDKVLVDQSPSLTASSSSEPVISPTAHTSVPVSTGNHVI